MLFLKKGPSLDSLPGSQDSLSYLEWVSVFSSSHSLSCWESLLWAQGCLRPSPATLLPVWNCLLTVHWIFLVTFSDKFLLQLLPFWCLQHWILLHTSTSLNGRCLLVSPKSRQQRPGPCLAGLRWACLWLQQFHKIGLLLCHSHIELRLWLRLSWGWGWFTPEIEVRLRWDWVEVLLKLSWVGVDTSWH